MYRKNTALVLFTQALGWNAFAYCIYKILSLSTTYLLYYTLSSVDFATWASVQSLIYLLLLWFSFGLRKSIPRYAPLFVSDPVLRRSFIIGLILFKLSALLLLVILFWYAFASFAHHCGFSCPHNTLIVGILLCVEGVLAVIQLLFQSFFLNKQFSTISVLWLLLGSVYNLGIIFLLPAHHALVTHLIGGYLISSTGATLTAFIYLMHRLRRPLPLETNVRAPVLADRTTLAKQFISHSLFMWLTTCTRSITQRNFLFLFFTSTFGTDVARLFKLTNDGAQLLHRIVTKMLGAADTALLTDADQHPQRTAQQEAFQYMVSTIALISIPLTTLLIIISLAQWSIWPLQPHLCIPIAGAYLLELLLAPYERLLEVKRRYTILLCNFLPLIILSISIGMGNIITSPTAAVISAHSGRLVSLGLMALGARKITHIHYPWKLVLILLGGATTVIILISMSMRIL